MLTQLKIKHDEIVTRAKNLASKEESLTEGESNELDKAHDELAELRSKIDRLEKAEKLEMLNSQEHRSKSTDTKFEQHKRGFDVLKVIQKQMGVKVDTGLEDEICDEIRSTSGQKYEGDPIPFSALQKRDSTTANTGALIATDHVGHIPALEEQLVTAQLGAMVMTGLQGNTDIPRGGKLEASWLAETAAATEVTPTFDSVELRPKKVAMLTGMSKFTLLQTSPSISILAQNILRMGVARAIDKAALIGGGTNEPRGILGGRGTAVSRTGSTNGKALTYKEALALSASLNDNDVGMTSRGYCTNHKLANVLKGVSRGIGTQDNMPVMSGGMVADERTVLSNLVPANLTKGTGTALSALIYGNWSDLIIGMWENLDLMVNPYGSGFASGKVQIRAMAVLDVAVRHSESFVYYNDIIATA